MIVYSAGLVTVALVALLSLIVARVARRFRVVDVPDNGRHLHRQPVPLLGGIALYLGFWAVAGFFLFVYPVLGFDILRDRLLAAFLGSTLLLILGILDDVLKLRPVTRLVGTSLAVLVTVFGGVVLDKVTNPWGGVVALDQLTSLTLSVLFPSLLAFVWIMGVMYTIKIVDGLDGLATGIVSIGSLIIFALSMSTKFYQPNVGLLALIFVGACLGFLVLNFSPAKLFLGESGSLFLGFILAVLSIIAGSKVATAFLVLAVPMLDLARVIILRVYRKQSVFQGDRRHLHYALLELGWSERQVILVFYTAATVFGLGALFLQSFGKLVLIALISVIMLVVGIILSFKLRTLKV